MIYSTPDTYQNYVNVRIRAISFHPHLILYSEGEYTIPAGESCRTIIASKIVVLISTLVQHYSDIQYIYMNPQPLTILVIEDDLVIAEDLREGLLELGYYVPGIATNWDETRRLLQMHSFDLALVDINLKGSEKDGVRIVQTIKEGRDIPIIYLTAFDDPESRSRAKSTQPAAYLVKPASKKQIDVAIDFALTNHHLKDHNFESISHTCPFIKSVGYYYVKNGSRYQKLFIKDLCYMQAGGSSCTLNLRNKRVVVSASLANVLNQISERELVRCHRSWAININYIDSFDEHNLFIICGEEIVAVPVSKGYKDSLRAFLPRIKAE